MKQIELENYTLIKRPGYFGRRKSEIIADLDKKYGHTWTLVWWSDIWVDEPREFESACKYFYELSYLSYLENNPKDVDTICSYGEVIDNAPSNINSGLDYTIQEATSTHIQDIAVRNCLHRLGRKFEGPEDKILVIRGSDSNGWKWNPGQIKFLQPSLIQQPSKAPKWAQKGSVEDFWQSNKYVAIKHQNAKVPV